MLINYSEKPNFPTKMTSRRTAGLQNDTRRYTRPMDHSARVKTEYQLKMNALATPPLG